jgi:hypothetical protein
MMMLICSTLNRRTRLLLFLGCAPREAATPLRLFRRACLLQYPTAATITSV